MTIPKIGDKIVRIKTNQEFKPNEKITPVENIQKDNREIIEDTSNFEDNSEEIFEESETSDFEDASLDDIFENGDSADDNTSEETTDESYLEESISEPESEEQETVINSRHPEENYSIEKFTQDFVDKLHKDSMPMLIQYDPERRQGLMLICLLSSFFLIAAIAIYLFIDFDKKVYLSILLLFITYITWGYTRKKLENRVKKAVMPFLIKAINNFNWISETPIPEDDITESKMFPNAKESAKKFYDCFEGRYRGINIAIAETKILAEKQEIFSGAIIRLSGNKDFYGTTIIRPQKEVTAKTVKDLKKLKYQKYDFEDIELDKLYNVYTTDQNEARSLLTTEFIDSFLYICNAFGTKVAYCSISGKYIYIAPYCKDDFFGKKDIFNICNLLKNVTDETQYTKLYNELISIFALIDLLKANKKL